MPDSKSEGDKAYKSNQTPKRSVKAGPTPGSSGKDSSSAITPKRVLPGWALC
jgi:hypothetical protein